MKMALTFLSKLGIIIGVFTILTSWMMILSDVAGIRFIYNPEYYNSHLSTSGMVQKVGILILILLAGVLSGLLVLGIVKKRHVLVVPWFVVGFLSSVVVSTLVTYDTLTRSYWRLDSYAIIVVQIGLEIIVLYPIWHLFTEIRSGNAAVGNPKEEKSNYVQNIQTTFDEISQKGIA